VLAPLYGKNSRSPAPIPNRLLARGMHLNIDAADFHGGTTAVDGEAREESMNYKNGIALDTYGKPCVRTLGSIDSQRLAQAYIRLTDAYRHSESSSPRNSAIEAKARGIARALAVSVC
jgi:hypothetical protein